MVAVRVQIVPSPALRDGRQDLARAGIGTHAFRPLVLRVAVIGVHHGLRVHAKARVRRARRVAQRALHAVEYPIILRVIAQFRQSARHRAGHARIRIKQRAVKIPEKFANHRFPLPFSEFFSMRPRISCFRFLFATILWDPSHISNGTIT